MLYKSISLTTSHVVSLFPLVGLCVGFGRSDKGIINVGDDGNGSTAGASEPDLRVCVEVLNDGGGRC